MIASINRNPTASISLSHSCDLEEHVSAIDWIKASELLVACGKELLIMKVDRTTRIRSKLPSMHSDGVRDIQVLGPLKASVFVLLKERTH